MSLNRYVNCENCSVLFTFGIFVEAKQRHTHLIDTRSGSTTKITKNMCLFEGAPEKLNLQIDIHSILFAGVEPVNSHSLNGYVVSV